LDIFGGNGVIKMDKAQAKKYIKGRQLEIKHGLEMDLVQPLKKKLREELEFLNYVNNVLDFIDDECDAIPEDTIFEYKGYLLKQSGYNNHYMIFKDGEMMIHCQCTEKLDQKKAEESIDTFIELANGTFRINRKDKKGAGR
jgi:hypothetical protein